MSLVSGCGSIVPTVACTPPVAGQSATINMTGGQPLKRGVFLISPLGAPAVTFRGCPLFYDAATTMPVAYFITDASGNSACAHIPLPASICGTQWTVQALVLGSGSSVSNALLCTVGG